MICNSKNLLQKLIRNNVITNDESGYAEQIIKSVKDSNLDKSQFLISELYNLDSDDSDTSLESDRSDDVTIAHYPSHRYRSNTAQKLEKIHKENTKLQKCKFIDINEIPYNQNINEIGDIFPLIKLNEGPASKVTKCLQKDININDQRPFRMYSKFDCQHQQNSHLNNVKSFQIYYHLINLSLSQYQNKYFTVMIHPKRLISDLIGLCCWKYTKENIKPVLSFTDTTNYSLHITEDNGEVDSDFPCLEPEEPVGKFGFKKLALVESNVTTVIGVTQPSLSGEDRSTLTTSSNYTPDNPDLGSVNTGPITNRPTTSMSPMKSFLDLVLLKQKKTRRRLRALKESKFHKG